jgi:hypothetical protein
MTMPNRERRLPARRIARRLLLGVFLGVVPLVVVEGLLRLAGLCEPSPPLYPGDKTELTAIPGGNVVVDPKLGWRMSSYAHFDTRSDEYSCAIRCNAEGHHFLARTLDPLLSKPGMPAH